MASSTEADINRAAWVKYLSVRPPLGQRLRRWPNAGRTLKIPPDITSVNPTDQKQ